MACYYTVRQVCAYKHIIIQGKQQSLKFKFKGSPTSASLKNSRNQCWLEVIAMALRNCALLSTNMKFPDSDERWREINNLVSVLVNPDMKRVVSLLWDLVQTSYCQKFPATVEHVDIDHNDTNSLIEGQFSIGENRRPQFGKQWSSHLFLRDLCSIKDCHPSWEFIVLLGSINGM